MSEYRVHIPITATVPVRSAANNPSSAIDASIKAVYGYMPSSASLSTQVDRDQITVEELPDGTPIGGELWTKYDG